LDPTVISFTNGTKCKKPAYTYLKTPPAVSQIDFYPSSLNLPSSVLPFCTTFKYDISANISSEQNMKTPSSIYKLMVCNPQLTDAREPSLCVYATHDPEKFFILS
jgi:hypothetical protein